MFGASSSSSKTPAPAAADKNAWIKTDLEVAIVLIAVIAAAAWLVISGPLSIPLYNLHLNSPMFGPAIKPLVIGAISTLGFFLIAELGKSSYTQFQAAPASVSIGSLKVSTNGGN